MVRNDASRAHGECMPRAMIGLEMDFEAIEEALDVPKYGLTGLARLLPGHRARSEQTKIIMDLMNRRAALVREIHEMPKGANWIATHSASD